MKGRNQCARCGLSDLIGKHDTAEDCLTHLGPRYRMLRRTQLSIASRMDAALARAEEWKLKAKALEARVRELEGEQSTANRLMRLEREIAQIRGKVA